MTAATRRLALRLAFSVSLLTALAFLMDVGEVARRLTDLRAGWLALALGVSVAQVVVSAWRWRYTAGRLGIDLPLRFAVREYYLATFLNQVLPGGVVGDVSRAWRQARAAPADDGSGLRSVHAVVLERTSGQAVMAGVALLTAGLLLLPRTEWTRPVFPEHPLADIPLPVSAPALLAAGVFGGWLLRLGLRRMMRLPALDRFLGDARRALLGPALPTQAVLSVLIVGSYVAVFVLAARAVGVETPASVLVLLVPPVLVTMLVPVSVAGWGVREVAAAILWGAVGLTVSEGVAVSVTYGLVVLVSSLPGAGVLLLTLPGRDRTGGRPPGRSGVPEAGEPDPASRWAGG